MVALGAATDAVALDDLLVLVAASALLFWKTQSCVSRPCARVREKPHPVLLSSPLVCQPLPLALAWPLLMPTKLPQADLAFSAGMRRLQSVFRLSALAVAVVVPGPAAAAGVVAFLVALLLLKPFAIACIVASYKTIAAAVVRFRLLVGPVALRRREGSGFSPPLLKKEGLDGVALKGGGERREHHLTTLTKP